MWPESSGPRPTSIPVEPVSRPRGHSEGPEVGRPGSAETRKRAALIYAVANQKGGVGKTTTAVNLAANLAQSGERVLLVDMDSQANASHGLGIRLAEGKPSILEVLLGEEPISSIIASTVVPGLDIVPSSPEMAGASVLLPSLEGREFRLKQALVGPEAPSSEYSFIFIDCPPSLGLLTINALTAADRVIIPVQTEYYALEGLTQLMSTIAAIRERLNPSLQVSGLVLTMMDPRTTLARQVEEEVRKHFPHVTFRTVVPRNVRLAEAPSHGLPVSLLDPRCAGSDAYFDLALEVVEHG
jgi:chromosome partitioning protein